MPGQPHAPAAPPRAGARAGARAARAPVQVAPQIAARGRTISSRCRPCRSSCRRRPSCPPLPRGRQPARRRARRARRAGGACAPPPPPSRSRRPIGERREKLNEDAQKEQAAWRDLQQALGNERGKLSAEQIRAKERELQDRITKAQREFRERGNIIQQAAQYGLAQIERTLVAAIQKVAESRGMNLVLHRQQVALNVNEFDITEQVTEQLNKVLPSVIIPPDGVSPVAMQQPPAAAHPAAQAQPAAQAAAPAAPKK